MTKKERFIYERCVELLKDNRIQHMSMDAIANYISVSKVTIYKYFKSREALMEKVLLFFLKSLMISNSEFYGIDKMKVILKRDFEKGTVDVGLMTSIMEKASSDFKTELSNIQTEAMHDFKSTFFESKDQGYFEGFSFEEFLQVYSIYVNGVIKSQDKIGYDKSIELFLKLILNTSR